MKNKGYKIIVIVLAIVCLILAYNVYSLSDENDYLSYQLSEKERLVEQLQSANYSLQSQCSNLSSSLSAANQRARVANMNAQSAQMDANSAQRRMDEANRNLDQAEFWGQAGDEFLSGNSYDAARRNLDGF